MATILVNHLRVRARPSVNSAELTYYDKGQYIHYILGTVDNEGRTWLKFRDGKGNERFICLRDINGETYVSLPVPPPPPTQTYRITCYCSDCNSPRGSTQTASGIPATVGVTVAVHPSKYQKNKEIYIEGIGIRRIQDKHGNAPDVIDVYVGNFSHCICSRHQFSGRRCAVTGL